MARLHEYQGKKLLDGVGVAIPLGEVVTGPEQARAIAERLGGRVVLKIQAWTTGRKAMGGVKFADSPDEAGAYAGELLELKVGAFPVEQVLVEECLPIDKELFVSLSIDDRERQPMLLLAATGGTGIEERADSVHKLPCPLPDGPDEAKVRVFLGEAGIEGDLADQATSAIRAVFEVARKHEARSVEINPLVTTTDGRVLAADCRMTIDDYAVFRHPELGIEIARELDHPPTELERIAYAVEQADHRGTFYFAQLNEVAEAGSAGLVGFHGAGGGGSMMSMDAIVSEGFTIANFTDTSGNPSASKVYRAARIIASQPGLCGYFGSGSGVASQEQFWSAYGLAKAFWELELTIPAVIRLGGNSEDRAVEILEDACRGLPAIVEGYKKDDPPKKIAQRFGELVEASKKAGVNDWQPRRARVPDFVGSGKNYEIAGGRVWVDEAACDAATTAKVVELSDGLFEAEGDTPVPAVALEELAKRDSELIGLEVELRRAGESVVFVELDIPGLV
jgi:succinyl-CoA synthetase beta subunit